MSKWSFNDIEADVHRCFQVQFSDRCLKESGCSGLAEYVPDGTEFRFQLQAFRDHNGNYLQVDWSGIDLNKFVVFPPPKGDLKLGLLGGNASNLCVLIFDRSLFGPTGPPLPELCGIGEWMGYYSDSICSLTLPEMTLPCSHNSGSYQPLSSIASAYVRCQSQSIMAQLDAGIRVLDLRVAQCDEDEFIISHDKRRTSYTLQQALTEVVEFVDKTSKEIVILDFHRFNNLSPQDFNYSILKGQVRDTLGDRFLPLFKGALNTPLQDLWRGKTEKSRIIVAWNYEVARDDDMWPGVSQEWYEHANSETKLHSALQKTFSEDLTRRTGLWSVCAFRSSAPFATPISNAKKLQGKLSAWFHGCAECTLKANILSTDFTYEYGNTIHAAICANLIKAAKKKGH